LILRSGLGDSSDIPCAMRIYLPFGAGCQKERDDRNSTERHMAHTQQSEKAEGNEVKR